MPTRGGTLTVILAVAAVLFGRVFGLFELFLIGAILVALVVVALFTVWIRTPALVVSRTISPSRVFAGGVSRADLALINTGRIRTPLMRIEDAVAGTQGAELLMAPLRPREQARAAYRLPATRRGRVEVGPMRVVISDPFGLARSSRRAAGVAELLVYPRIDIITPPPRPSGDDTQFEDRRATSLGHTSEDFYALRNYVVGDDLRRVHWPSTARHGELMVRQDELPRHGRVTILLDTRSSAADPQTFEAMVSAAASMVVACRERDDTVRFITTDGVDTGFTHNDDSLDPVLDVLALVPQRATGDLAATVEVLARNSAGAFTAMVGQAAPAELNLLAEFGVRFGASMMVQFNETPTSLGSHGGIRSPTMVTVAPGRDFAELWEQALAVGGPRAGRRR
jgi:uncharacterized protein (DUF58 family)